MVGTFRPGDVIVSKYEDVAGTRDVWHPPNPMKTKTKTNATMMRILKRRKTKRTTRKSIPRVRTVIPRLFN